MFQIICFLGMLYVLQYIVGLIFFIRKLYPINYLLNSDCESGRTHFSGRGGGQGNLYFFYFLFFWEILKKTFSYLRDHSSQRFERILNESPNKREKIHTLTILRVAFLIIFITSLASYFSMTFGLLDHELSFGFSDGFIQPQNLFTHYLMQKPTIYQVKMILIWFRVRLGEGVLPNCYLYPILPLHPSQKMGCS